MTCTPSREEDQAAMRTVASCYVASSRMRPIVVGRRRRGSLGATGEYNGRPSFEFGNGGAGAERWQILSPVRSRTGGIAGLNRLVRRTWRAGEAAFAHRNRVFPSPMGADEVLFHDKVMCVENRPRKAKNIATGDYETADVANGEIGMAVGWPKKNGRGIGLWVEFSTQPGLQFAFWESELNSRNEAARSYWKLPTR